MKKIIEGIVLVFWWLIIALITMLCNLPMVTGVAIVIAIVFSILVMWELNSFFEEKEEDEQ